MSASPPDAPAPAPGAGGDVQQGGGGSAGGGLGGTGSFGGAAFFGGGGVFQRVLDRLPQQVFWKGTDLRYLGCNRAFAEAAGLSDPTAVLGRRDADLPRPPHRSGSAAQVAFAAGDRALLAGEVPSLMAVTPAPGPGGTAAAPSDRRWWEVRRVPLRDADGAVAGVLGTASDVTDREAAARDARRDRQRLELALAGGRAGLWDWNVVTDEAYFSERWTRQLGRGRDEVEPTGAAYFALIHPSDRPTVEAAVRRNLRGREDGYEVTVRMRHAEPVGGDRGWVWVRASGRLVERDSTGGPLRMAGLHVDVTASRLGEAALRDAEERFRRSFEQSGVPTCLCDEAGAVTRINGAFLRLLGRTADAVLGDPLAAVTHPADLRAARAHLDRLLRDEVPAAWETRFVRPDGAEVWAQLDATALRDPRGRPRELLIHAQDTTARKTAEARLRAREAADRHAHRMEAVGTLAGGIAHEFNNLLQVVAGHAAFAEDGLPDDLPDADGVRADLRQVRVAADRAAVLTRQLLDFSRTEEPGAAADDAPATADLLDADEEVAALARLIGPLIVDGVTLRLTGRAAAAGDRPADRPEPAGRVRAGRTELQQALMNLCLNARDAVASRGEPGPAGGVVTLGARRVEVTATLAPTDGAPADGSLIVGAAAAAGPYVRFEVADDGPGVPPEIRGRIFDPFFTTKPPGRGTGMGLAAVHRLAKRRAGRLTLRSVPGDTAFGLELPLADPDAPSPGEPPPGEPPDAPPTHPTATDSPPPRTSPDPAVTT